MPPTLGASSSGPATPASPRATSSAAARSTTWSSSAARSANSWRHERWDSLRLLTPNWLSRLPDHPYDGPDPDGYMTAAEVADAHRLVRRAVAGAGAHRHRRSRRCGAPTTATTSMTDGGTIRSRAVVIASGACNVPTVPALARGACRRRSSQVTAFDYRSPDQLPDGGVLVVGASATGVQLAAELRRSGRPVTLSVGEHVRLPRTYRGRDVLWWMDASGVWDERYDQVDDLTRARRLPSPQLVGTPERATLDLNALTDAGVELVGRLGGDPRRPGPLLRRPAQRVLARRPQAAAAARQLRRLGPGQRPRRRAGRPRAARADPGARVDPAPARPGQRRDRHGRLGDRLPPRLLLARRAGGRREGPAAPRRAGCSRAPASTPSASRSCAAASPPSSTASRTTRARWSTTSRATWTGLPSGPATMGRTVEKERHMPRQIITTDRAPRSPLYSQGVKAGAHVFVSGTTGVDVTTGKLAGESIQVQTHQALANCEAILDGRRCDPRRRRRGGHPPRGPGRLRRHERGRTPSGFPPTLRPATSESQPDPWTARLDPDDRDHRLRP